MRSWRKIRSAGMQINQCGWNGAEKLDASTIGADPADDPAHSVCRGKSNCDELTEPQADFVTFEIAAVGCDVPKSAVHSPVGVGFDNHTAARWQAGGLALNWRRGTVFC